MADIASCSVWLALVPASRVTHREIKRFSRSKPVVTRLGYENSKTPRWIVDHDEKEEVAAIVRHCLLAQPNDGHAIAHAIQCQTSLKSKKSESLKNCRGDLPTLWCRNQMPAMAWKPSRRRRQPSSEVLPQRAFYARELAPRQSMIGYPVRTVLDTRLGHEDRKSTAAAEGRIQRTHGVRRRAPFCAGNPART